LSDVKNTYISERICPKCNGLERYIKWNNCVVCQKENQNKKYAKKRRENNRTKNNEALEQAKLHGNTRFTSLDECKTCGANERYTKNRACTQCVINKINTERQLRKEIKTLQIRYNVETYLQKNEELDLYAKMRLSTQSKTEWMKHEIAKNPALKKLIINVSNGHYDDKYRNLFNEVYKLEAYDQLLIQLEQTRAKHIELPLNKNFQVAYNKARMNIMAALTQPNLLHLPNFLDIDPQGEFREWINKNLIDSEDRKLASLKLRTLFQIEINMNNNPASLLATFFR
jgi:RecJ-like exonuclease